MVASTMNRSPGTSCRCSSSSGSPRDNTTATPSIDSSAPSSWRRLTGMPQTMRPRASIHTGMLELTRVTFSGVEVLSARYSSAL